MILPSRTFGAARGDPGGGEIPMRLMHSRRVCSRISRASWTNIGKMIDTNMTVIGLFLAD